jgi:flavin reductase (DIM6/NTAB) family NADH-FMN oxidoreductase RutF
MGLTKKNRRIMKDDFISVSVLDNFYQTSFYYPMPVVMVTTVSEEGDTNIGSYSLCFPFGIAGKHSMMLISRFDSNTAANIRRSGLAALNFIPYRKDQLANAVRLGYPGQTTEEKLKESRFTLIPSRREEKENGLKYPDIIKEAVQIMECTWQDDPKIFNYNGSSEESHFLLIIDSILMKNKWHNALIKGNGRFPSLPIDYGYRDSKYFWFAGHSRPYREPIPSDKGIDVNSIIYQVQRLPYDLEWEDAAYAKLIKVPRIFLKRVLETISKRAVEEGIKKITPELLDEYNKKRR